MAHGRRCGILEEMWPTGGGVVCENNFASGFVWKEVWFEDEAFVHRRKCALGMEVWSLRGTVIHLRGSRFGRQCDLWNEWCFYVETSVICGINYSFSFLGGIVCSNVHALVVGIC